MPQGMKGAYKMGISAANLGKKGAANAKAVNASQLTKKRGKGDLGKVASFKEKGRSRGGFGSY